MMIARHCLTQGIRVAAVVGALLACSRPAAAYIDLAATLPRIATDSQKIAVVEVATVKRDSRGLILKEVRALKGELSTEPVRHVVSADGKTIPRSIATWAVPGARAVLFQSRDSALVCLGEGWYQVAGAGAGLWKLVANDRPDLPLAYHGSLSRLIEGLERILAGKETVLTVVAHGADNEGASFDLALNRHNIPGLVRVERIRAHLNMPGLVMAASANASYLIGPGPVDARDLPTLLERLKSADATIRAEAADDLRSLGRTARGAIAALTALLPDESARVGCAAAAALVQIDPGNLQPLEVLARGLASPRAGDRRDAARAAGSTGTAAKPLVGKIAALLRDGDESVRLTALQALTRLGATAGSAVEAVLPLLDEPDLALDAADALGRMGIAARPALKRIARFLSDERPAYRWAAIRALSQIGGDDARPAVDFMIRALPKAPEMERYNMMIYLALLGPVAKDATPTIRTFGSRNPVLPAATLWAIEPDKYLPWQNNRGPGFGGPPGGGVNFGTLIYENYVHELGERLRPAVRLLARKIVEGTAGDVPAWGYKILLCDPGLAVETFLPCLSSPELVVRERATVALGYMGSSARQAAAALKAGQAAASNEQEKRLIAWSLREIAK